MNIRFHYEFLIGQTLARSMVFIFKTKARNTLTVLFSERSGVYMNQAAPNVYTVTVGSYTFIDSR